MSGAPTRRPILSVVTRYRDDPLCQALVARYPDGMDYTQIGELLGVSRQRAEQIAAAVISRLMGDDPRRDKNARAQRAYRARKEAAR